MCISKRNSRYLTLNDRKDIEYLFSHGFNQSSIALRLGVSRATICRELPCGMVQLLNGDTWEYYWAYSAQKAQQVHEWRQSSRGTPEKIGNNYAYLNALAGRILDGYSPEESLLWVESECSFELHISKPTLYRYIQNGYLPGVTYKDLPHGKRKKRYRKIKRVNISHPEHRSIEHRSKHIDSRQEFGHWEFDSIIGKAKGKRESLLVLTERKTRQEIILRPSEKTAAATVDCLRKFRRLIGSDWRLIFKTITCDNGAEFSDQNGIEKCGSILFFCHPSCPSERGSNENANKLIRRKLPKGQSLKSVTPKQAHAVQQWVNHFHRPMFGGLCSNELFHSELNALPLDNRLFLNAFFI